MPYPDLESRVILAHPIVFSLGPSESDVVANWESDAEASEEGSIGPADYEGIEDGGAGLVSLISEHNDYLESRSRDWRVISDRWAGYDALLVESPKASGINHRALFPPLYRCIKEVSKIDQLARILGVSNWRTSFERVLRNRSILRIWRTFMTRPNDCIESEIEFCFADLVMGIANKLGLSIRLRKGHHDRVGGLLANERFDVVSECDVFFVNEDGVCILSTEVKTRRSLPRQALWYRRSRGTQTLISLFAKNAPTFLLNHHQWKVFVENRERTEIRTYPFGRQGNRFIRSTHMRSMSPTLIQAIVVCLLARPTDAADSDSLDEDHIDSIYSELNIRKNSENSSVYDEDMSATVPPGQRGPGAVIQGRVRVASLNPRFLDDESINIPSMAPSLRNGRAVY